MSDLPTREDTLVAISRWVGREPEVAYDLHPDLRVILNAARGWSSGRLVDREAFDYEAAARSRYDARFGDGAYDGKNIGSHARALFLNSATRDVDAALPDLEV